MKKGKESSETEWVRNVDKRENFIKKFGGKDRELGEKKFLEVCKKDPNYEKLQDILCPPQYSWIFKHFMQIWQNAEHDMMGNVVFTFRTINEYVECFKVPLTVEDKEELFKMKNWALETISELKEKED